jgi:hypothetical protein
MGNRSQQGQGGPTAEGKEKQDTSAFDMIAQLVVPRSVSELSVLTCNTGARGG